MREFTSSVMRIHTDGELRYLSFPAIDELKIFRNAFTTRLGGVSKGCFATMNLSFSRGDNAGDVAENYKIICKAAGFDYNRLVLSNQKHELNVRVVTESDAGKGILRERDYESVDAMVTNCPGLTLVTQYADCVPLLLCDPVRRCIGAAHASWRCTAGDIGGLTVRKMTECYGTDPADLIAGIAPSICGRCFETDFPVYERLGRLPNINIDDFTEKRSGKYYIDLKGINRQALINSGVKPENITVSDLCTKCRPDIFFSHRVTGFARGNLAAFLSIAEQKA